MHTYVSGRNIEACDWYKYRVRPTHESSFDAQHTSKQQLEMYKSQPSYITSLCHLVLGMPPTNTLTLANMDTIKVAAQHCKIIQSRLQDHPEINSIRLATDMALSLIMTLSNTCSYNMHESSLEFLKRMLAVISKAMVARKKLVHRPAQPRRQSLDERIAWLISAGVIG